MEPFAECGVCDRNANGHANRDRDEHAEGDEWATGDADPDRAELALVQERQRNGCAWGA